MTDKTIAVTSTTHSLQGFTLLELVVVMVLLSILATLAVPRLLDLGPDARLAATESVASALASASASNYASRKANSTLGQAVTNCTDIGGLQAGILPTGFVINALPVAADTTVSCTLTHQDGTTSATFTAIGTP